MSCGKSFLKFLRTNWFMLSTVFGVGLGFGLAFILRAYPPGPVAVMWILMPASLYLRILQLTILPLIASNVLVAIGTLNFKKNGKIGLIGILYILTINLLCSIDGTIFAVIIQPGTLNFNQNITNPITSATGLTVSDIFKDILYNLFPDNLVATTIFHHQSEFSNDTQKAVGIVDALGSNMIGLLFCSIVFGAAANISGKIAEPFINFFKALSVVVTKIMSVFLLVTPVAVCFMVAGSMLDREDIQEDFIRLGLFVATVLLALVVHFILITTAYFIASRRNPLQLLRYSGRAFILAFATTSPVIALPETYVGLDNYGVSKTVSRLVGPLGATLKGDGPAAFISASVIFVAQQSKFDLNVGQIFTVAFLTFSASLAVPNIPSASIILITTILSSIGVPSEGVGLLFAMEWLLDRCRSGSGALSMMYLPATTEAIYNRVKKDTDENESVLSGSKTSDLVSEL